MIDPLKLMSPQYFDPQIGNPSNLLTSNYFIRKAKCIFILCMRKIGGIMVEAEGRQVEDGDSKKCF